MDLGEYWQENKRFVLTVGAGVVAFFIGLGVVDSVYGADLSAARVQESRYRRDLRTSMYTRSGQDRATEDHDALEEVLGRLRETVAFQPRPEFTVRPGDGSASGQYHTIVGRVRDDLGPAAARANLRLEETLGLPDLSPTQEGEIERYLEGLDVIDRVARSAMRRRVARMEDLDIRLDPGLTARGGVGAVERTTVEMRLRGDPLALTRCLADLARTPGRPSLLVERVEMIPSRNNPGEARLDLVLVVARLHDETGEEEL